MTTIKGSEGDEALWNCMPSAPVRCLLSGSQASSQIRAPSFWLSPLTLFRICFPEGIVLLVSTCLFF